MLSVVFCCLFAISGFVVVVYSVGFAVACVAFGYVAFWGAWVCWFVVVWFVGYSSMWFCCLGGCCLGLCFCVGGVWVLIWCCYGLWLVWLVAISYCVGVDVCEVCLCWLFAIGFLVCLFSRWGGCFYCWWLFCLLGFVLLINSVVY